MLLKRFAAQLAVTAFLFAVLYACAVAAIYMSFPFYKTIDTEKMDSVVYDSQANYLVMGRRPLMKDGRRILICGSSSMVQGIRPSELGKYIKGYEIHNIGLNAANVTQMQQIAELMFEAIPRRSHPDTVFVIGLAYPEFRSSETIWGKLISDELARFGLYGIKSGRIAPAAPKAFIRYSDYVFLPVILTDKAIADIRSKTSRYRENISKLGIMRKGKKQFVLSLLNPHTYWAILTMPLEDPNKVVFSEADKKKAIDWWRNLLGGEGDALDEGQFGEFDKMVEYIHGQGSELFIVDLPVPRWHADRSVHFRRYQKEKVRLVKNIAKYDRVYYIDMQDMNRETDFKDSAHPKPRVTESWSKRLAAEMKPFLGGRL